MKALFAQANGSREAELEALDGAAPDDLLAGYPGAVMLVRRDGNVLARNADAETRLVPWALGANGGASVVASILCIAVAMESGFRTVSLFAMGFYVLGTWLQTSGPLPSRFRGPPPRLSRSLRESAG